MTYEQEPKDAGVFVAGAALQSYAAAAKYVRPLTSRLPGEPIAPSNGQELQIGGYYLIACASDEDALEWARKMPTYGLVEVRPELSFEGTLGLTEPASGGKRTITDALRQSESSTASRRPAPARRR